MNGVPLKEGEEEEEWRLAVSQLHSIPWWRKGGERISKGTPLAESKPKDVCSAGSLEVCMCGESTQYSKPKDTHTYTPTYKQNQRIRQSTQWNTQTPTHSLGLVYFSNRLWQWGYFTTVLSNNYYTSASFQVQHTAQITPFDPADGSTCPHEAAESIRGVERNLNDSFPFKTHHVSWKLLRLT